MANTLLAKFRRDLVRSRGRLALLALAVAAALFGLGAVLGARGLLVREMERAYRGTLPAHAAYELARADDAVAARVAALPGIAAAEVRGAIPARVQVSDGVWQPLLLFVVRDFNDQRLNLVRPAGGAWPPPAGSVLVERAALAVLGAGVGAEVRIKTPAGARAVVARVAGLAYDPGLAPAWQEKTVYAYATAETARALGEPVPIDELRVAFRGVPADGERAVRARALELGAWLVAQGHAVKELRVPPPGRHPHQGQMEAVLALLLVCGLGALLLAGVLLANTISSLMARERRQIGVLKAIGADTRLVAAFYLGFALAVGLAALAVALPLGAHAATALAGKISSMMNFDLADGALPAWTLLVQAAAGILGPLGLAAVPVVRAGRRSVRAALDDQGAGVPAMPAKRGPLGRALAALVPRRLALAVGNALRRRGRFALTLLLLAVAGGLFIATLDVREAWLATLGDAAADRHYDFEIRLARPHPAAGLERVLAAVPGVRAVEAWGQATVSPAGGHGFPVARTYPDRGHGGLTLRGVPVGSRLVTFPLLAGRWIRPGEPDALVLTQLARDHFPGAAVGSRVVLDLDGRARAWRVVGIVRELGPAACYADAAAVAEAVGAPGAAASVRIVCADGGQAGRAATIRAVETALGRAGIPVAAVLADALLKNAVADHIAILVWALVGMAILLGIVGLAGLAAATGSNVAERTREFGVLRAVGATPGAVLATVVGEALFTASVSLAGALALSVPLAHGIGALLGTMAFRLPLPVTVSATALLAWPVLVWAGAALAAAAPALAAARLPVREALAYE